jgi:hypothetical protein
VSLAAVLVVTTPASAMKYVAIRYWPTSTDVSLSGGAAFRAYDNSMVSLSYRQDFGTNWAASANLDFGAQSNWAGTWAGATEGSNTYWNVNVHRTFMATNAMGSIFIGYQRAGSRSRFGTDQTQTVSGLRVGADLAWQGGPWGLMAWAAVGISPWGESAQPGFTTATGTGSFSEYGAILSYQISGFNLEGGYRVVNFGVPAGGSFSAANFNTRGLTVGISKTWP